MLNFVKLIYKYQLMIIVVFDDVIHQKSFYNPDFFTFPLRIGYHTISVSSQSANIKSEKKIFLLFNEYIGINYCGISEYSDKRGFVIWKNNNPYTIE